MGLFWKATGVALLTLVLSLAQGKKEQSFALLLTTAACCMVAMAAASYLEPVVELLRQIQELGHLQQDMLSILLKAVGIGLVSQLAAMVCGDAGNGALAKQVQFLGSTAILYLSVPVFSGLLELIQEILEKL